MRIILETLVSYRQRNINEYISNYLKGSLHFLRTLTLDNSCFVLYKHGLKCHNTGYHLIIRFREAANYRTKVYVFPQYGCTIKISGRSANNLLSHDEKTFPRIHVILFRLMHRSTGATLFSTYSTSVFSLTRHTDNK